MLVINSVQFSKSPVATSETIKLSVDIAEVLATWGDIKKCHWDNLSDANWEQAKLRFFEFWENYYDQLTWGQMNYKTWRDIKIRH